MTDPVRRQLLLGAGALALGGRLARAADVKIEQPRVSAGTLPLADFRPKSMLHAKETAVPRARFPVIDFHTHVTSGNGRKLGTPPENILPWMDRKNLRALVNLTGGTGAGLAETVKRYDLSRPGRFVTFTEPSWDRVAEPGYAKWQGDEIARAVQQGARGLKILKTLGLYLREQGQSGPLVKVDDPRFDPMWEACAAAKVPVAMHVSDPEAFFLPVDASNERLEELGGHPTWSFHGKDFPSNREIMEARNRVLARHPRTTFVTLHVGNGAENLAFVGECLDRYKNMHVDIAARIGELGRQPRASGVLFDKYQDRILFGTDSSPPAAGDLATERAVERSYEIYFRFLETRDEYFSYSTGPVPSQGRWMIYGLGLADSVLQKVYADNAARLLRMPL